MQKLKRTFRATSPYYTDGIKLSTKKCWQREQIFFMKHGFHVETQCTPEQEATGLLQTIYEDGKFFNQDSLTEIRKRTSELSHLITE